MRRRTRVSIEIAAACLMLAATAIVLGCAGAASPPNALPLKFLRDVQLPGRATRFDYQSFDPKTGLLFIALKPFEERDDPTLSSFAFLKDSRPLLGSIKEGAHGQAQAGAQ